MTDRATLRCPECGLYGSHARGCIHGRDDLQAEVASLTAENERLRKRLEAAWDRGDEDANQKVKAEGE